MTYGSAKVADRREFIRFEAARRGEAGIVDAMGQSVRQEAESRGFRDRREE